MYVGYEPPTLGFLCRAKPPTDTTSDGFPTGKARPENSRRKKSTCGSISRKASQTVKDFSTDSLIVDDLQSDISL